MDDEITPALTEALELARSTSAYSDIQSITEHLDTFLELYSTVGNRSEAAESPCVSSFYRNNRPLILAGTLMAVANLGVVELPLSFYPARMLRDFVRDVTGPAQQSPSTALLAKVQRHAPTEWGVFVLYMSQVGLQLLGGRWPTPTSAELALQWLRSLQPTWARVVIEARAECNGDREYLKDAAVRRAFGWYGIVSWQLRALASRRQGPLRLLLDYMLGLLSYYETALARSSDPSQHRSAQDALVLEVFSLMFEYLDPVGFDAQPSHLTLGSRGQASTVLRKRLQRARLRSIVQTSPRLSTPLTDVAWSSLVLPALDDIKASVDAQQRDA